MGPYNLFITLTGVKTMKNTTKKFLELAEIYPICIDGTLVYASIDDNNEEIFVAVDDNFPDETIIFTVEDLDNMTINQDHVMVDDIEIRILREIPLEKELN